MLNKPNSLNDSEVEIITLYPLENPNPPTELMSNGYENFKINLNFFLSITVIGKTRNKKTHKMQSSEQAIKYDQLTMLAENPAKFTAAAMLTNKRNRDRIKIMA
jgi:hypothetical protein